MYGQQFVPNQVYGQPNMMSYPTGVIPQQPPTAAMSPPGAMIQNYNQPAPPQANQFRGGFQQSITPIIGAQHSQPQAQQPWQQQQPTPPQQQPQVHPPQQGQLPPQQQVHPPRPRNNEIGEPSRVVHMRNVTPEVTQLGIQNLAQNFGTIKSVVMLRQMNQALVEMETVKAAEQLVDFFRDRGYADVDGRRVYVRYSNHNTLTATHQPTRTLLVSMFNTQYDVSAAAHITPEIVYQIFANYGKVQRIVVLPKNESSQWNHNRVQALVQFDAAAGADRVKNILQGQPVTLGDTVTFTLDIQFSRMDEIKTTNPLTSLIVDENGNMQRPEPQPPQPQPSQQGTSNGQPSPNPTNVYAAVPQQWS